MNLFHPWIYLRLVAGLVSALLFLRAAAPAIRVLRHFDLRKATEGQLALERQSDLGAAYLTVATLVQALSLLVAIYAANRLHGSVRGAMCGYGVLTSNEYGIPSITMTLVVALLAGVVLRLVMLDGRMRGLSLVKPIAVGSVALAPLAFADLMLAAMFVSALNFDIDASCCSTDLDASLVISTMKGASLRGLVTLGSIASGTMLSAYALWAARWPSVGRALTVAFLGFVAFPLSVAAVVLEVAPHVFEVPVHLCPFCLFDGDGYYLGYPLFGALSFGFVSASGLGLTALVARRDSEVGAVFGVVSPSFLRGAAVAWCIAFVLGLIPIVRYAWLTKGGSLFP